MHILAAVFSAVLLLFSGCSQFDLDENPGQSQLVALPYPTTEELELAVTGAYSQLWLALRMTTGWVSAWGGDDLTTSRFSSRVDFREYDQRTVTPGNTRTQLAWRGLFTAIRAANTVLVNIEQTDLADRTEQDRLTGEAFFLRAYCYHHLIRMFEELPIITTSSVDFGVTLTTREEVFLQIESDYKIAASLLPVASNLGAT
ncbi:MAG: RagB/SusD family nutrient uptake outer membrane protein, partial [Bacteroidota bacterium]